MEVSTSCQGEGFEGHGGFFRQRGTGNLGPTPASLVVRQGEHSWLRKAESSKSHQGKSHHPWTWADPGLGLNLYLVTVNCASVSLSVPWSFTTCP